METEYVSLTKLAALLGVSRQRVNVWVKEKRIETFRSYLGTNMVRADTKRPDPKRPWELATGKDGYKYYLHHVNT